MYESENGMRAIRSRASTTLTLCALLIAASGSVRASAKSVTVPCAGGKISIAPALLKPFRIAVGSCASGCMRKVGVFFRERDHADSAVLTIQVNSVDCMTSTGGPCPPPFADFSSGHVTGSGSQVHTHVELFPDPCWSYTLHLTCSEQQTSETVDMMVSTRIPRGITCPQ